MEKLAKIYKLTNKVNGFVYIGQTMLDIKERMEHHLKRMRDDNDLRPLYTDLRNHGIDSFEIEVVDECFERHKFIVEEYWYYHFFDQGLPMYDIKRGAKHSKNTIQRMAEFRQNSQFDYKSEIFKDKISEKTTGELNGMYGKKDEKAVNGRMVIAYDKKGEVMHEFNSVKIALKYIGVQGHIGLNNACKTGKEYKGYFWKKEWINR